MDIAILLVLFVVLTERRAAAYSVLTHEQIVDFVWDTDIKRLLLQRFPGATPEDLRHAHAFAYGGCLLQDMGYYPFGNKFFSDLAHYVRSGDFVTELIRDSQNVNELAFALGALAHYVADTDGHPTVNAAVALSFPKLRKKYGNQITYAENPKAHIQTEFGFDVLQVAKQRYAADAYHDFIGFEVAIPVLERTFQKVYGIDLKDVFHDEDRAIGSYRHAVSGLIPRMTRVALITKKKELAATPDFSPRKFRYLLSRADYEKSWGKNYTRPGCGTRFLAFLVRLVPKIGPLRVLDIKTPTAQTERMYVKSVEDTVAGYRLQIAAVAKAVANNDFTLPNKDFDTGKPTQAGEYNLTDEAYARLLRTLADRHFDHLSPELRSNILGFYSDLGRPIATKQHPEEWKTTLSLLDALRNMHDLPQQAQ